MPQPSAGAKILASDFGFASQEAAMAAGYSVTTTQADISLSSTFSTTQANQVAEVTFNGYVACQTASARYVSIYCLVDGAAETNTVTWLSNTGQNGVRLTQTRTWRIVLAVAGSHTVKFQAVTGTTNGDYQIIAADMLVRPSL
jgi:hypothetical protein